MAKKFSDFGELGELKGLFRESGYPEGAVSAVKPVQKPRTRGAVNKSRAELPAEEGIVKGTRVRMMETNDCGVIAGFCDGWFEIEAGGLVFRAQRCEFVVTDAKEDRLLMDSVPVSWKQVPVKQCAAKSKSSEFPAEISVDLHLDKIPGGESIPQREALDFQMNYFRRTLRSNLKYRGRRLIFIHGVGDGILASALRRELDETFAISCTYTYSRPGVTVVIVR